MQLTEEERKKVLYWLFSLENKLAFDVAAEVPAEVLNAILKAGDYPRPYVLPFKEGIYDRALAMKLILLCREKIGKATDPVSAKVIPIRKKA
jgi:hypothetical protein